uniref:Uncharacterized protein AlNc14C7G977 n=1 Tax=Albugo laibachii Nc14 TaxID=890382 RepID=F0W1P0_9STRA|nr:conserved hypothetical protein [Albugo laibachii Nc14]|eukprot:CCA14969.1 conserved hypothetical protein [Albugo laibachii Nc14]
MPKAQFVTKKKPADFKRPKRKVGRKAAPRSNVTSVSVKSRRLHLLEQSALQNKEESARPAHAHETPGDALAWTRRHLTLNDLLHQMMHYNGNVRQKALCGVQELVRSGHGSTLLANISPVLERILSVLCDHEAIVRDAAVSAWKLILPALIEGSAGKAAMEPFARLLSISICSGMTHIQSGIRQDTLRVIKIILEIVPEMLTLWAGVKTFSLLIENFSDIISSSSTQGVQVKNQYEALRSKNGASKAVSKARKMEGKVVSVRLPTGALGLRFSALAVLHNLLEKARCHLLPGACNTKTLIDVRQSAVVNGAGLSRCATAKEIQCLLIYPNVHDDGKRNALGSLGQADETDQTDMPSHKFLSLVRPLLEIWMECSEHSADALSEEYIQHMQMIIQCVTIIFQASGRHISNLLIESKQQTAESVKSQSGIKIDRKLLLDMQQEFFLHHFPMYPGTLGCELESVSMLKWHEFNISACNLGCSFQSIVHSSKKLGNRSESLNENFIEIDRKMKAFLLQMLETFGSSTQLRRLPGVCQVISSMLQTLDLYLNSNSSNAKDAEELLRCFTSLYTQFAPRSKSFSLCTEFAIRQLSVNNAKDRDSRERLLLSRSVTLSWLNCVMNLITQTGISASTSTASLSRQGLNVLIETLKTLPNEMDDQESLVQELFSNIIGFFELPDCLKGPATADSHSQSGRFVELDPNDQFLFASIVYHSPQLPIRLLQALAPCCKSPKVHCDVKTFLLDILLLRKEELNLGHFVSFLVTTAFREPTTLALEKVSSNEFVVVSHVGRVLLKLNLGTNLSVILTPLLASQASDILEHFDQMRNEQNRLLNWNLKTLIVVHTACLESSQSDQIEPEDPLGEIHDQMVRIIGLVLMAAASVENGYKMSVVNAVVSLLVCTRIIFERVLRRLLDEKNKEIESTNLMQRIQIVHFLIKNSALQNVIVQNQKVIRHGIEEFHKMVKDIKGQETENWSRILRQLEQDFTFVLQAHQCNDHWRDVVYADGWKRRSCSSLTQPYDSVA